MTIPEGTVYNSLYDDMAEDFGVSLGAIYNPELTYTYTILASGIDSVMAGELSGALKYIVYKEFFCAKRMFPKH